MKQQIILIIIYILCPLILLGNITSDSIPKKRKGNFVFIPATAYTPETGFTFGAFNEYYFDFAKDSTSRMSKIQFGGIYTTKKQMYFGLGLELFSKNENYYAWIKAKYSKFVDRDYGLGNDAQAIIHQYDFEKETLDSLNYLDFKYQSAGGEIILLKKIKKGIYGGLHYWYEKLWDYEYVKDSVAFIQQDLIRDEFNPNHLINSRSGIALAFTYDTRKNSNNPLNGEYIQFRNWYYRSWLGSDFNYTSISLDARKYFNTYKDQVFAIRFRSEQRYPIKGSYVPKFDLARVGGKDFARGYYDGTYIDNHLMAFEAEYRLPLWHDPEATIWQFWRRLGIVVFTSGSRVYENWDDFSLRDMRFTVGVGGRMVLSQAQKVNARIDIGLGLDPNSDFRKRHLGVYVYISEAF